jgi:hypothetical protein
LGTSETHSHLPRTSSALLRWPPVYKEERCITPIKKRQQRLATWPKPDRNETQYLVDAQTRFNVGFTGSNMNIPSVQYQCEKKKIPLLK